MPLPLITPSPVSIPCSIRASQPITGYGDLTNIVERETIAAWYRSGEGLTKTGGKYSAWADRSGNSRDLTATVNFTKGTDPKGRACPKATGTEWGQVDYGEEVATVFMRAVVCKADSTSGFRYVVDGIDADHRAFIGFPSDAFSFGFGGTTRTGTTKDTSWHVLVVIQNGSNDELWIDGTREVAADAGSDALSGITFCDSYNETAPWVGTLAEVVDIISPSSEAVPNFFEYAAVRYGI